MENRNALCAGDIVTNTDCMSRFYQRRGKVLTLMRHNALVLFDGLKSAKWVPAIHCRYEGRAHAH